MEGNGFKENGTHVFWPYNRTIYSRFYINMAQEGEKLFGISEQNFGGKLTLNIKCETTIWPFSDTGPTAPAGARISTNDHLAFVKVVGPWNDEMSVRMEESNGYSDMDQYPDLDRSMTMTQRLDILKNKIDLYFKWYHLANISTILQEQTSNPAQLALLSTAPYDSDSECLKWKLFAEMGAFSAGLSSKSYKRYDKSALMCLHMNPMGIESSTEGDGTTGWWLPLNHNFIAWRAMAYQQPMSKFMQLVLHQCPLILETSMLFSRERRSGDPMLRVSISKTCSLILPLLILYRTRDHSHQPFPWSQLLQCFNCNSRTFPMIPTCRGCQGNNSAQRKLLKQDLPA